jgi:hypothetical protein
MYGNSNALSWNSLETAADADRTSTAGEDGMIGAIGASAIALAPTSATPVVNHGRIETSMCNPNPEKFGKQDER